MTLAPGAYIRMRREARDLSRDDVALGLETVPHVSARSRAEYLAGMEEGRDAIGIDAGLALQRVIGFDWNVLLALSAVTAGIADVAPPICRLCACSEWDPCDGEHGDTCAWAEPDLCTACAGKEARP